MVLFIHRPEYYHIYEDAQGRDLRGLAEIIIAKHRNGAVGDVLLAFKNKFARFQNVDDEAPMPGEEGIIPSTISRRRTATSDDTTPPPPSADDVPFAPPVDDVPF